MSQVSYRFGFKVPGRILTGFLLKDWLVMYYMQELSVLGFIFHILPIYSYDAVFLKIIFPFIA